MATIIIMALIGGLLSTLFINTHFIRQFFRGLKIKSAKTPPDDTKQAESDSSKSADQKSFDFGFYGKGDAITFLVTQAIFFAISFVILLCYYYFSASDRTISKLIISTGWFVGLIHFVNWLVILMIDDSVRMFKDYHTPEGFSKCALIISISLFVISCGCGIVGDCYNFTHQEECTTFIQDEEVSVISIDSLQTLKDEVIIDGYGIGNAIKRNGKIVVPMYRENNVSYAGYVVIENDVPRIVPKTLRYTPNHESANNPKMVARENLPTKIFFGNWSFQLKPTENGEDDVYYVCAYGHFRFLRAGRVIEGLAFINAETGEFSKCTLDEVPEWITGISQ